MITSGYVACEQALHLGEIVKSRRARGTREARERRREGIGELARRLVVHYENHAKFYHFCWLAKKKNPVGGDKGCPNF